MPAEPKDCCHEDLKKPLVQSFLFWIVLLSALTLLIAPYFKILNSFPSIYGHYLMMMGLPLLLGLLLGGAIDYYIPKEYISHVLAGKKKRTILYATALGFLASSCSHGVLAIAMELHKKGASSPAVISFLLAAPWASMTFTLMLIGFFGWKALLIILSAILISLLTGGIFLFLDHRSWIEHNPHTVNLPTDFSIRRDFKERLKAKRVDGHWHDPLVGIYKGALHLAGMVMGWVLVGFFLAALLGSVVPQSFIQQYMGASASGLFVTLFFAIIIEVCSEGSSPIAFEIYRQTGALGNAFALLMGGVATDWTEIGLIASNLGRRTALCFILATLPQVLILASLLNLIR